MTFAPRLLTDPFLQLPTPTSVRVVWFTEFPGAQHTVQYGSDLEKIVGATTIKLSRTREDAQSQINLGMLAVGNPDGTLYQQTTEREIWRHEAEITDLTPGKRLPYRVTSVREDGLSVTSETFSLAPTPLPGTALKILLTSDHQVKPMVAPNLQKVVETVGQVDAVFHAGDLANIPDRASEWFDDKRGGAFFPCLQGRARVAIEQNGITTTYHGGQIIQNAPIFPTLGNHEVMGRFSMTAPLNDQFADAFPLQRAEAIYQEKAQEINPDNQPFVRESWLHNNSFNADTYEEIFSLPTDSPGGKKYYAVSFGDLRLVVLEITNMWRPHGLSDKTKGKYREPDYALNKPEMWGWGQHIFEPISQGSEQYRWLQQELNSPEFQQAKYKIVMFHHPPHSLGENSMPAYTNPVQRLEQDATGRITIRYEYPKAQDYIIRDVVPLLEAAGVQLVYYGHSHLWNRFISPSGMHFLESSNVGNTYHAYVGKRRRPVPHGYQEEYTATGNPNSLPPVLPNIAPLLDEQGEPMPYIASNQITAFSILDTGAGTVSSYYYDTLQPNSSVVKFDEFMIK
ncbi:MAG TPA: metallophosphoesterase family protein [Oscillatoriaceae cyanobacterium M33_DOE_052]|uniref:Metallophosphoesterase family protein n=1 Tax=Planktothricoides sp. SpSt-374 TaxID=2282167 RepID=A0A7C3VPB1_9CYAN|nr:metallophosphoesterase family protein [Oscillatoriaceae cyanobacterium M33_DOE_052]